MQSLNIRLRGRLHITYSQELASRISTCSDLAKLAMSVPYMTTLDVYTRNFLTYRLLEVGCTQKEMCNQAWDPMKRTRRGALANLQL